MIVWQLGHLPSRLHVLFLLDTVDVFIDRLLYNQISSGVAALIIVLQKFIAVFSKFLTFQSFSMKVPWN